MNFISPEYFLLIPALALAGWFWRSLRLQAPLRAVILLLAVLALADPRVNRQQDSLDLYVLLDRSDSTEDLIDRNLPEWQRLLEKSKPSRHDTLHLINYAAEVAELGADGSSFTGSRKLTRTGLALSSIAAQVDEKRPSRVLLFTDGFATEPLQEAAAQLQARGVPLDFRLIRDEKENDFRLSRFSFPERVQIGEPFLISVTVRGAKDGEVPLIIRRNGVTLTESKAQLVNGVAGVEFTDRIQKPGAYEYQAEIRPEEDAHPGNNLASRWIEIRGGPRLILATRYQNDPMAKALEAMNFEVETVTDETPPWQAQRGQGSGSQQRSRIRSAVGFPQGSGFLRSRTRRRLHDGRREILFRFRRIFPVPHRRAAAGLDGVEIRTPQARRRARHRSGSLGLDGGGNRRRENQDGSGELRRCGFHQSVRTDG
jgi:hypothetical protein